MLGLDFKVGSGYYDMSVGYGWIYTLYTLGVLIPAIAVAVRRMHDVGKSGWFLLIPIYNLILAVTDSKREENKYGSSPKS